MKRLLAIVVLILVITCLAFGQQQTAPPPKPGPEVQRLGSLVGTWKTDTGEKVTYEWFDGGFSVVGHVENSGPEGKSTELRIITYDSDAKTYSQYRITSTGPGGTLSRGGTLNGNTWVWPLDGTDLRVIRQADDSGLSDKILPKMLKTYCSPIEDLLYMGLQ